MKINSLLLASLLCLTNVGVCEDETRGRTADGKAFRTDPQGNEIVDYIAELELSNDSLNRRVVGLEQELQDKLKLLERKSGGKGDEGSASQIAESDISPSGLKTARSGNDTAKLRERIASLEDTLAKREEEIAELYRNSESESREKAERELVQVRKKLEEAKVENDSLRADLETKKSELVAFTEKANAAHSELQNRVATLTTELERKGEVTSRARYVGVAKVEAAPQTDADSVNSVLAPARARAIEALKTRLVSEVSTLRGQISTRDALYSEYKRAGRKVGFSLTKPVSSRGIGVQEISGRLKAITSIIELSAISRDIREIQAKVQNDTELIKRVKKL